MPTIDKRLPLLDWDNGPMKNEHYGAIRELYRKYPENRAIGKTVAQTLAKAPYAANAVYNTLPKIGVISNESDDGSSLMSVPLQRWPHFNPFVLPYINVGKQGVAEELMHAMDWMADSPLHSRRDYQQAVKAGNRRLYDHGSDAAKRMFMDNFYQDEDIPVNNDWRGPFNVHGKVGREIMSAVNALAGNDDFTNEPFLYSESVPRLMLADPDTAQKYYPEAMHELRSFFNEFPPSDDDLKVRFNVNLAK